MNISKRLKTIADLVDTKNVIDVGCDHGYLDIYLTLYKNCQCKACDISENAINNCIENIKKYNLTDKIKTIITDGIKDIEINDNDTIILSGMGTKTIINILNKKKLPNNIIISSNNNLEELRRFMTSIGYFIQNEIFITESKINYVIIKFNKGIIQYNDYEYILGPIVINNQTYRKYMLNHYQKILSNIPQYNIKLRKNYNSLIKYLNNY